MKNKHNYYSRKFLNKNEGLAAIESSVDAQHPYKDVNIHISDCHRHVSLDFGFRDKKGKKEMLVKLGLLIAELQTLSNAIEEVDV